MYDNAIGSASSLDEAGLAAQLQVALETALRNVFGSERSLPEEASTSSVRPALVDKDGACIRLGISNRTLENLMHTGRLPYVRAGRRVLFSLEALDRWIADNTVPAK